jgi:polypeptide N-acetylgalactosaminyltransferase
MCVDYAGSDVMIYPCHGNYFIIVIYSFIIIIIKLGSLGNQQWLYEQDTRRLRHGPSRKCLAIVSKDKLSMETCENDDKQKWKLENFDELKL